MCPTLCDPWTEACQSSLSFTISWSLLKLMSIELVMTSNHLILCHPFLLPPSIFPSIRVISNDSALRIGWPKDWSCSFSPLNEYSGFISFRIDWFDLLAVQGTLESLQRLAFFTFQLSHPYMTTRKTIAQLCYPVDFSTSRFSVFHYLPGFAQTHVH